MTRRWAPPGWLRVAAISAVLAGAGCASDGPDAGDIAGAGGIPRGFEIEHPDESGASVRSPVTAPSGNTAASDDSQAEHGPSEDTDPCVDELGLLSVGQYIAQGAVATGEDCVEGRLDSDAPSDTIAVQFHTFTLNRVAWVNFTLETAPSDIGGPTVQLFLLDGHGGRGEILEDARTDSADGTASIGDVYMTPGRYTLEVRTDGAAETNDYELTVTVPLSGLGSSIVTTIDADNIIKFDYWPPHAQIWLSSTESNMQDLTSFLQLGLGAADGEATIALSPGSRCARSSSVCTSPRATRPTSTRDLLLGLIRRRGKLRLWYQQLGLRPGYDAKSAFRPLYRR